MKKILPILTIAGASLLFTGCANGSISIKNDFQSNINSFKEQIEQYSNIQNNKIVQTALNKYALSLDITEDDIDSNSTDNYELTTLENLTEDTPINEDNLSQEKTDENTLDSTENNTLENGQTDLDETIDEEFNLVENPENSDISSIYYLNADIAESCDEFCELKEEITEAITETENLIDKIQRKEIVLNREQRLFLTSQSEQLKSLSNQLTTATNELSFSLSEINTLLNANNESLDSLSFKYLAILNNIINGNEMLHHGLSSLNMINNVFKMNQNSIPENNQGRILYGFQRNNEQPIIKDYYIDQNGNMIENNQNSSENDSNNNVNDDSVTASLDNESTKTTDTYKKSKLQSNIDTYGNFGRKNIDTFFNTALLDNEFMYGNGGYGYNGFAGGYPYLAQQNYQYSQQNKQPITSDTTTDNTQHVDNIKSDKPKKKFTLTKNVDTYKNASTPSLNTKFANIKSSVSKFFGKFKNVNKNIDGSTYKIVDNKK